MTDAVMASAGQIGELMGVCRTDGERQTRSGDRESQEHEGDLGTLFNNKQAMSNQPLESIDLDGMHVTKIKLKPTSWMIGNVNWSG